MKESLRAGIEHELRFVVPGSKTVPHLYPESEEFGAMPEVFATGFFVGLVEWACVRAVNPHLDRPGEQTLGTRVDLTHEAATPPGMEVTVRVRLEEVDGRRLRFGVLAVVPGDARVDLNAVEGLFGGTYVSFASRDVAEELAGSVAGTILPFSFNEDLELIADPAVLGNGEIFFNAARLDRSVALNAEDYAALARPRLERIAERAAEADGPG